MELKSRLRTISWVRTARDFLSSMRSISDSPYKSIFRNMEDLRITSIIDVGANVGQFGLDIRKQGFKGLIVSYEPVKKTFGLLTQTIKQHQPWKSFQLGLGAEESERVINVSGNDGLSSSLLEMRPLHLKHFPDSATVAKERVSISTIDKQLEVLGLRPQEIMLKLDVQGFESEVLKGAAQTLSKIPLVYLEVSIAPLYEKEISFLPILIELSKFGHEVIDVFRGIKGSSGQLLQLDILTKLSNK